MLRALCDARVIPYSLQPSAISLFFRTCTDTEKQIAELLDQPPGPLLPRFQVGVNSYPFDIAPPRTQKKPRNQHPADMSGFKQS
jgi:hypothetical protein